MIISNKLSIQKITEEKTKVTYFIKFGLNIKGKVKIKKLEVGAGCTINSPNPLESINAF